MRRHARGAPFGNQPPVWAAPIDLSFDVIGAAGLSSLAERFQYINQCGDAALGQGGYGLGDTFLVAGADFQRVTGLTRLFKKPGVLQPHGDLGGDRVEQIQRGQVVALRLAVGGADDAQQAFTSDQRGHDPGARAARRAAVPGVVGMHRPPFADGQPFDCGRRRGRSACGCAFGRRLRLFGRVVVAGGTGGADCYAGDRFDRRLR